MGTTGPPVTFELSTFEHLVIVGLLTTTNAATVCPEVWHAVMLGTLTIELPRDKAEALRDWLHRVAASRLRSESPDERRDGQTISRAATAIGAALAEARPGAA
jgi:hypothetical protein